MYSLHILAQIMDLLDYTFVRICLHGYDFVNTCTDQHLQHIQIQNSKVNPIEFMIVFRVYYPRQLCKYIVRATNVEFVQHSVL